MLVVMPLLYWSNRIDFKDADNLFNLRVCFYTAQALTLLGIAVLFFKIKSTPNETKVKVPPPPTPSFAQPPTPPSTVIMTAQQYDLHELRKVAQQTLLTLCIISFLHFKWELTAPLCMQSVMTPKVLLSSPLFKGYFLGAAVTRPFPVEANPLQQLMNPQADDDNATTTSTKANTPSSGPRKKKSAKAE